jgi:hypothetical protein
MQESIAITPFMNRLPGLPVEPDRIGDLGAGRQQFRREIFGKCVVTSLSPVQPEADAASAHHVEKQRALGGTSVPPRRDREIVRPEPAAVALDQLVGGAAREHRIDRLQRPVLIEHDALMHQIRAVEHDSGAVKILQQVFGLALHALLAAERGEFV